jgi:hypothetical protein
MLGLSTFDHCHFPADGLHSMRQTSRVIPPIVALDVGDLSSQEAVACSELPALGSAGHHPAARRLLSPAFEKVEP